MNITDVSNLIVIIGVIMAPIGFFSFFARLKNEMKRDSKESFETAAQLQNTMNSMMATFVMALMRGGVSQAPQIRTNNTHSHSDSGYEEWSLYEEDDREFHYQLPSPSPVLGNKVKKRKAGSGFLVGLLSGISVFLLLALITVLKVGTL